MYYPVCLMMHIKDTLLLIGKSSLCGGSRFPLSLSEWFFTIIKGRGMCHPVCEMMHIKDTLLLIEKSTPCGGSRFPLSRYLSGSLPYV